MTDTYTCTSIITTSPPVDDVSSAESGNCDVNMSTAIVAVVTAVVVIGPAVKTNTGLLENSLVIRNFDKRYNQSIKPIDCGSNS